MLLEGCGPGKMAIAFPERSAALHEQAAKGQELMIVGVAVIRSWRCVTDRASHPHSWKLIRLVQHRQKLKRGILFIEHEFLRASRLQAALPGPPAWEQLARSTLAQQILQSVRASRAMTFCEGQGVRCVSDVLEEWASEWKTTTSSALLWPVDPGVAQALASGQWWGDVSCVPRRVTYRWDAEGCMAPAPCMPPPGVLRAFKAKMGGKPCKEALPPLVSAEGGRGPASREIRLFRGSHWRAGFHAEHAMRALRAGLRARAKKDVKETIISALMYLHPLDWDKLLANAPCKVDDLPAAVVLRRYTVRFDIAWMLHRREQNAGEFMQGAWRYLSFDASPQGGHGIFGRGWLFVPKMGLNRLLWASLHCPVP